MTKLFTFIILTIFSALISAQPDPWTDLTGTTHTTALTGWTCTINLNNGATVSSSHAMGPSHTDTSDSDLDTAGVGDEDEIDTVSWQGTSCNCWVILFEDTEYDGQSLGFWLGNNIGIVDLSRYVYLDDTDALSNDDYYQWNTAVSSFRIYCY